MSKIPFHIHSHNTSCVNKNHLDFFPKYLMHHEENKLDMLSSFSRSGKFPFSAQFLLEPPSSSTITYNSRQVSERVKISFLQILLIYISLVITPRIWYPGKKKLHVRHRQINRKRIYPPLSRQLKVNKGKWKML